MELRFIYLLVVAFSIGFIHCQLDEVASMFQSQNTKKIYCGTHLSKTLSAVCKGNYNTLTKKYSRGYGFKYAPDMQGDAPYPYKSKMDATSLITKFRRRKRRGVYNECCEKPCSHEELSSYCGATNRRR